MQKTVKGLVALLSVLMYFTQWGDATGYKHNTKSIDIYGACLVARNEGITVWVSAHN